MINKFNNVGCIFIIVLFVSYGCKKRQESESEVRGLSQITFKSAEENFNKGRGLTIREGKAKAGTPLNCTIVGKNNSSLDRHYNFKIGASDELLLQSTDRYSGRIIATSPAKAFSNEADGLRFSADKDFNPSLHSGVIGGYDGTIRIYSNLGPSQLLIKYEKIEQDGYFIENYGVCEKS